MTKFVKFNGIGWDIQKEKDEKCSLAKINFWYKLVRRYKQLYAPMTHCKKLLKCGLNR